MILMRRVFVTLLLVGALAGPAVAQDARVPYSLTFDGTSDHGTIVGSWGGSFVQGTYGNGQWVIVSGGAPVVGGTYQCGGGCTFDGTLDYGQPRNFSFDVPIFDDTGRARVSGSVTVDLTPPVLE